MKTLMQIVVLVLAVGAAATVMAGGPESGFYMGAAGNIQLVKGTGTWAEYDFQIDKPLSTEGEAVGLNWADNLLLGVKPIMGYKLNPNFALQVGYVLTISKSSQQALAQQDLAATYEQGFSNTWDQRSLEILGIFYPSEDMNYFFLGGVDLTHIKSTFTLYEGVEFEDYWGTPISQVDAQIESDSISAMGFIVGGGMEFPSGDNKRAGFFTAQYSTAKTNDDFYGTPDFKVNVGGLSFAVGAKWYLGGGDEEPAE